MPFVTATVDAGIAELVLDRPKVNALSRALLEEMLATLRQLGDDEHVRGVLVRGEGKCFSAGLDLVELSQLEEGELLEYLDIVEAAFTSAFAFPKPMVAAVHGHAVAGGLVLALCADHLVMGRGDYKLGLTELAVGVPFPRPAFEIVRLAMGPRALNAVVHGAGTYSPQELFDLGVGDALSDDPRGDARRWLSMMASRPLGTFRFVKTLHRGEAWERIQSRSAEEQRALIDAITAARTSIARTLG
jgi:enoyl-CoA hydratase